MCGIYVSVSRKTYIYPSEPLRQALSRRGPDHVGEIKTRTRNNIFLLFTSTVLSLRGGQVVAQPLIHDASGSTLCWNGEAWKIRNGKVKGNDGEALFSLLTSGLSSLSYAEAVVHILDVLRGLDGPAAFMFHDNVNDVLYFARDCLGRRSLLYDIPEGSEHMRLSSVSDTASGTWKEVEADGIYMMDLSENFALSQESSQAKVSSDVGLPLYRFSWDSTNDTSTSTFSLGKLNSLVPQDPPILNSSSQSVIELENHLLESLKLRVLNIPDPPNTDSPTDSRIAVLFSGGLDCTVLARMAHDLLPPGQSIDLLNVAFENPRVVEAARKQQEKSLQSISKLDYSTGPPETAEMQNSPSAYEACPDRITGRSAVRELRKSCPGRHWRFIEVNIPYTETLAHKDKTISLMSPHNTEMDLSIASALYFASRGSGMTSLETELEPSIYTTTARVLLSGLGADELFGGYTRHATAFSRQGFPGLIEELELDVTRLGKRNLGRDDRIISDWSKEARYPYLDETLIRWALECPVWAKCGFGTSSGSDDQNGDIEPGKKVLRLLAAKLGLQTVAREKKRAVRLPSHMARAGRQAGFMMMALRTMA